MIYVTKCPYRISLLGGSSDLDWFVKRNQRGISIGLSIQAYSTIVIKFSGNNHKGILNYSSREEYSDIENISHPIIREAFKFYEIERFVELASFGDSIGGSGLGSSSSFLLALIKGLNELKNISLTNMEAAHIASEIEINKLNKSIGRQDQYLCSLGGINILEFSDKKTIKNKTTKKLNEVIKEFSKELFLVNTGKTRSSSQPLNLIKKDINSYESIKKILDIADKFVLNSENLDRDSSIDMLHNSIKESWNIKRLMPGVMNTELFLLEKELANNNFEVLKLLGAGGGGYFLCIFKGKDINNTLENLKLNKKDIIKVDLDYNGLMSWKIN